MTEPATRTAPSRAERDARPLPRLQAAPLEDVRSTRPYLLSASSLGRLLRRTLSIGTLVGLDLCALALGLYAALVVRELAWQNDPSWRALWRIESEWLPFLALVTLLVFWRARLYASREFRTGLGRIVSSLALVALLTFAFARGTGHEFTTYGLIPTAVVLTALLVSLFRAGYEGLTGKLMRFAGVQRRAVLVGEGETLDRLRKTLGAHRVGIDYALVGVIAPSATEVGLPVLGGLEQLPSVLAGGGVDELIVADSDFSEPRLLEIVEEAHRRGVEVRIAPKTTELLIQRGEYVPGQGVPLFELRPPVFAGTEWALKRTFDIVVSSAVLVLGLPFWVLIAAAIKLSSRGPVFYRDVRVGLGEREFAMLKFRTMTVDAPSRQAQLEVANEADGALFKIHDDPRITPVGRFLRRFSLDEIPQVLNVLRGEMSLVGPRPLPLRDFERLEPWHRKRYNIMPGMTGLWQIAGRSHLGFDDLVRLDFYYLDNWSIWLDISILVKTIPAVLARRGAY
ncbi:MAG: sugar transferase [Actinomycetota bacterium]|nr:sugar transferase [Actinomycetota bacterium]